MPSPAFPISLPAPLTVWQPENVSMPIKRRNTAVILSLKLCVFIRPAFANHMPPGEVHHKLQRNNELKGRFFLAAQTDPHFPRNLHALFACTNAFCRRPFFSLAFV